MEYPVINLIVHLIINLLVGLFLFVPTVNYIAKIQHKKKKMAYKGGILFAIILSFGQYFFYLFS